MTRGGNADARERGMSDTTQQAQELFGTLDEYLLELADGLAKAQQELGGISAAGAPGRQFTYYVPKLEFELRMDLRVETSTTAGTVTNAKALKMRPVRLADVASSQTQTEVVSVIRGSFVAVPANEGLPPVVLDARCVMGDGGVPGVVVRVRNAAGEALPGVEVEFNLDRRTTQTLSGVAPLAGTDVVLAVVRTDAAGEARTTLRVAAGERARFLALTVDAASRTLALSCEVPR
ncbi:hypothetical protein D7X96_21175 [Corallococcus interemptor]|uniref:Uncharacterized protein n=2 Tax=Corallococcus interemptor TaxID=2316720 RepID=A0A3A8QJU4_9BACT|nr:hypothetical protein D7Y23_26985 [Corallococcus sp. AB050B]RKH66605.1 hypothetical protein D7X96_21175 [Corallococcus interemptor]